MIIIIDAPCATGEDLNRARSRRPKHAPCASGYTAGLSCLGGRVVIKWGLITFGAGIVLIIIEIMVARNKKEGFTATDRQRVMGIFGVTIFATALVMGLIWMT